MGLNRRKKSGKKIGGSRLIVDGQEIYSTKTFQPDFNKKRKSEPEFLDNISTTTTTTKLV